MTRAQAGSLGGIARATQLKHERQKRIDTYNENPRKCRTCDAPLSYNDVMYKKVYCTRKCRVADFMPRKRISLKPKKKCLMCNSLTTNAKFCSSGCCGAHERSATLAKVLAGEHVAANVAHRVLIQIKGHRCETCGNTKWLGKPIPLDRHHVDGDNSNNSISNVKLLCKNCHALTPTFGNKNKG